MEPKIAIISISSILLLVGGCSCVRLLSGAVGALGIFLAADYFRTKDPTFSHKLALKRYLQFILAFVYGWFLTRKINKDTADIKATQDKSLLEILKLNATSEYSKKRKLDQVKDREELRKIHPLTKFKHFESFMNRTAAGEKNVIVTETPLYFGATSGTTGNPSLIPFMPAQLSTMKKHHCLQVSNLACKVPGVSRLNRSMRIYYNPQRCLERTPSGILSGPLSACPNLAEVDDVYTSPPAAYDIENEDPCRYIHVLFGLRYRDLTKIETLFASIVYYAFEEIKTEWKDFVKDIRNGTLKAGLNIPDETRKLLEKRLFPDPKRADELEREFKKGFLNIAKRIWPKLSLIHCTTSGPFAIYTSLLREKYVGDISFNDPIYGATEGILGTNIWQTKIPAYLLLPYKLFFEFIKAEDIPEEQPKTYFMDELEIGQDYELVLTTVAGLTRYRMGDVLKVVRHFNQAPVVEFQYRSGHLLNIRSEKMSEITFIDSLNAVIKEMPNVERVVDFAICTNIMLPKEAEIEGEEPCYVFFAELTVTGSVNEADLEKELAKKVDAKVMENHSNYRFYREKNALGPLRFYLVKPAGFVRLRGFMLDNSKASPSQIKLPKVLIKPPLINFMYSQKKTTSK